MKLSKPQKLIYDMEKFAGGSIAVICGSMLTNGKREISELKRALKKFTGLTMRCVFALVKMQTA